MNYMVFIKFQFSVIKLSFDEFYVWLSLIIMVKTNKMFVFSAIFMFHMIIQFIIPTEYQSKTLQFSFQHYVKKQCSINFIQFV